MTQLSPKPEGLDFTDLGITIEIPVIESQAELVNLPLLEGNNFAVSWLNKDAGLLEGSDIPGEGISVIAAHNHINTGEIGPFLFLMNVIENDRIFVRKPGGEVITYKVYANLKIDPKDTDTINQTAKPDSLILITCEDESAEGGYLFRRVVFAEKTVS